MLEHSSHQLVVWDLGLSACQVKFLLKKLQLLGTQLQVKDFPFTSYPLYFRSIIKETCDHQESLGLPCGLTKNYN